MEQIDSLVRFLPWDSSFFGHRIARVVRPVLEDADLSLLNQWSLQEKIDCLYFLSSETGGPSLWPAQNYGFRLIDLRVTLAGDLKKMPPQKQETFQVSLASEEDIIELRKVAAHIHQNSRFYADPHFERSKCHELYQIWIENSLRDPNCRVYTYKPHGKALGYVASYKNSEETGVISLAGVSAEHQGQGIGSLLVASSLHAMRQDGLKHVEVVTQGSNFKAIQLYEKCGFRVKSIQTWFHKWYE